MPSSVDVDVHALNDSALRDVADFGAQFPFDVAGQIGPYVNQSYVDKVLRVWNNLEVAIPLKNTEV